MWDRQNKNLKYELTNRLIAMLGVEHFNRPEALKKVGEHLKIVRDQYKGHLSKNPRYEHPPMIPVREWISILNDGREYALRKQGKLRPNTRRYAIIRGM